MCLFSGFQELHKRMIPLFRQFKLPRRSLTAMTAPLKTVTPPVADKIPHVHEYHGRKFPDAYHWMKDQTQGTKRPEIVAHLNAENAYTAELHIKPNEALADAIYKETLTKIKEEDDTPPVFRSPFHYYSRTVKGQQYSIRCRKLETMEAPEEVLLDLNTFTEEYLDLHSFEVSPDHSIVAYALDMNGSEVYTIFFKDLKSGQIVASIEKTGGSIEWFNDNKTVIYNTLDATHRSDKVWKYEIGGSSTLLFHQEDEKFIVSPGKSLDDKYMLLSNNSSLTSEVHYIDASKPQDAPQVIIPKEFKHEYSVEHLNGRFVIISNAGGHENFQLVSIPVGSNLSIQSATPIIPYEANTQVLDVVPIGNWLGVYECSAKGFKQIRLLQLDSASFKVTEQSIMTFPEEIYDVYPRGGSEQVYDSGCLRIGYESMTTPRQIWSVDLKTGQKNCLKALEFEGFNPDDYVVERLYTETTPAVPISLVYRKDKKKVGMPLYLYGYGSYGISIDPGFSPQRFSLLDRGVAFAIAHIRGGGDCSRTWYNDGKFKNKRNTFTDFIAAAKHLVAKGYTSHSKMAIEGRSAGGLLMGAVLNLEPTIAHVAVAGVPFVDVINTMMDETIPLTINEYEEWGNPNDESYFDYILSYSPYNNLAPVELPHLLVKAGINDPRVQYWEPMKWVAKMRETPRKNLIVFDCKMGSGHFGSTGRYAYIKEIAMDYAFVIKHLLEAEAKN